MQRQILRRGRGQALVEFALFLPILLLILVGIGDTGLMLSTYSSVSYASRQGARLLEANGANTDSDPDPTIIQATVNDLIAAGISIKGLKSITIYSTNGD